MKKRHKIYLKLNLMSLVFIVISFISVTLAWFAYSGLADVSTEIGVKAWYIELEKDGEKVSNDIVISLSDIYPGMQTVDEIVNIKNLGDSDALVKYSIVSARILDEDNYTIDESATTSFYVEDILSHNYPFHINMNLSKGYTLATIGESIFKVSVSWPLDSGDNEVDTLWGTKAYLFQKSEEDKKTVDSNYQISPSIQVIISVNAEQYIESDEVSDVNYNLGDIILFSPITNSRCSEVSSTCLKTYVVDNNNKIGDDTVTLLPDPTDIYQNGTYSSYNSILSTITAGWITNSRALEASDLLKVISNDITNSYSIKEGVSDSIIGNLNYGSRLNTEISSLIIKNGYYKFTNEKYNILSSNNCYWTNSSYDVSRAFAVKNIDENYLKIYDETKTSNCKVIPIIVANKSNL